MSSFPTRILLATDGSREADLAASAATGLARKTDSELDVIFVMPTRAPFEYDAMGLTVEEPREEAKQEGQRLFDERVKRVEERGGAVAGAYFRMGRPDAEIVALAEKLGVDLIVIGSRGLGPLRRALVGSVSESVVHHAHTSVLVVRPFREEGTEAGFALEGKILAAVDGSEEASLAARRAGELAGRIGAELHVLSVGEHHVSSYYTWIIEEGKRQAREVLDRQVRQIEEAGGVVAESHVRVGQPTAEIVAVAEEIGAGLLMMGSRGMGGVQRALMGSVSDSVVRYAHCPVMVVRSQKKRAAEPDEVDVLT